MSRPSDDDGSHCWDAALLVAALLALLLAVGPIVLALQRIEVLEDAQRAGEPKESVFLADPDAGRSAQCLEAPSKPTP
jgi:hypothetical protein